MGLWAWLILLGVLAAIALRWFDRMHQRLDERRGDGQPSKEPEESGRWLGKEADQRMRTGMNGLNERLPFLGGQSWAPAPVEDKEWEDAEDPHRIVLDDAAARPPWEGPEP